MLSCEEANFQCGDFMSQNTALSGKPSMVSNHEIVDHVYDLILANQQISAKSIAESEIFKECVAFIIHIYSAVDAETVSQAGAKILEYQQETILNGHLQC